MTKRRSFDALLIFLLGGFDFLAVYFGYLTAYFMYENWFGMLPQRFDEVAALSTIPAGLCIFSFVLASVYRCQPGPLGLDQLRRLLSAYFWSALTAYSLTFFTKAHDYSRLTAILGFSVSIIYILAARALFIRITAPIRRTYRLNRKILILGAGKVGTALARNLVTNATGEYELVGFLDDQYPEMQQVQVKVGEKLITMPILGKLSDLEPVCRKHHANEVIVAMTHATHTLHQDLFDKVKDLHISFSIVPSALDLMLTGAEAYSIGRIPLFRIGERPAFVLSPVLKRGFDLIGAAIIAILSSPIWILTSILIKYDSRGPILFVHERVGKNGMRFKLFKFRSMHLQADPYAVTPRNFTDDRITKVGRFLRRTSIDEIPQLINIFMGDMSLVGPRPEMPFIVEAYDELQKLRLTVKPGLTGVWQISADRANPIHENIDYDLYYLENQSFWLDLAILLKTFTSVLKGVGAY
jgi:exopolysaccharide biosynthesis polyprenyl glycosylphosphotransferase